MEGAGKLVEDEDLREAMKEKGLGTPATRAAIIETLLKAHYLVRHGKELQPTAKAMQTISLLKQAVPELTSPEMTGEWEFRLRQIEHRQLSREEFMRDIRKLTEDIVREAKQFHPDEHVPDSAPFGRCPKCGQPIVERFKSFTCTNDSCDFTIWKTIAGRLLSREEFETLLEQGRVGPLHGFRSRKGKRFDAVLRLSKDFKAEFDFGNGEVSAPVDFTAQTPLGPCPKCGARVFEHGSHYVCEKSLGPDKTCDFRTGKVILQQPVERAQVQKLLAEGRTDLLPRFISRKGRPFKARLVVGKDGDIEFEFEPRESKSDAEAEGKPRKARAPKPPPEKLDFTGQQPLGKCPRCGGRVFESDAAYVCENSQAAKRPCRFKTGKVICQQPIDRAQMSKLLAEGRTDLLTQFISRWGKPFSARLVLGEDGKVNFEFPPRREESAPAAS
jgi:DNA topoisomerase-3